MLEKLPESIGHALQGQRAGLSKILFNKVDLGSGVAQLTVSSPAFADHASIPARFTADAAVNADADRPVSPPLRWQNVPQAATTLALIVEDADSPTPEPLVHAVVVDIDPTVDGLLEGELRGGDQDSPVNLGRNSYLQQGWLPPDPPPGHGVHRYAFQLFALKAGKAFSDVPGRSEFAAAVRERAIASGLLIGTYERDNTVKIDRQERVGVESVVLAGPDPLDGVTS
jgi:Raf kinase inhibitor-like YbhB/YbcL family protein